MNQSHQIRIRTRVEGWEAAGKLTKSLTRTSFLQYKTLMFTSRRQTIPKIIENQIKTHQIKVTQFAYSVWIKWNKEVYFNYGKAMGTSEKGGWTSFYSYWSLRMNLWKNWTNLYHYIDKWLMKLLTVLHHFLLADFPILRKNLTSKI